MKIAPEILKELRLSRFVALDIETTGLDYLGEEIIEFGAVRYVDGVPSDTLNFLIKPAKAIPRNISRITGITNDMVNNVPDFNTAADQIIEFISSDSIIAHNIIFDVPFLEYHLRRVKGKALPDKIQNYIYLTNKKYDSLLLAKIFLPYLSGFSLSHLKEHFEVKKDQSHRALPDAEAAGEIFLHLVGISLKTDFKDLRNILKILEPTDAPIKSFFYNLQSVIASGKYHFPGELNEQEIWYRTNYYNIIGEGDSFPEGRLQTEPLDVRETGDFFDDNGMLHQTFGSFELRRAQVQMAKEVTQSFNQQNYFVVEAGTGTGKSLAYLLPALKWSIKNYGPFGRVVISTNTKNLQEQLFFKDLPILHSILKEKFKAVLLKGKSNYLCLDKWFTVLNDMKYRLSTYERVKMLPLYFWLKNTETGDISENNGFSAERNAGLWSKFIAENNYCPGKSCKYYNRCFLWRARNNAKDAHIILINHSLLFSDLAADRAVLSEYANLIIDEAHNIEKTATEYLGTELTIWYFRDSFQKLYKREKIETGIFIQLKRRIQMSDLKENMRDFFNGHLNKLIQGVQTCWSLTQGFFKELTIQLQKISSNSVNNSASSKFRYRRDDGLLENMSSFYNDLKNQLTELLAGMNDLLELFKEIPTDSFKYQKQLYQELQAQYAQLNLLINNMEFLLSAEWDTWVYWFELPLKQRNDDSRLYAAPLNISEILYNQLYKNLNTIIFTSATLTVEKKFNYFVNRIGLNLVENNRLQTLLLESPFNYPQQVFLAIPVYMPDPRSPAFREKVQKFLQQLSKEQRRGTLVLFTAYSLLNEVYEMLRNDYDAERIPLLAQGINGSRHTIVNKFKEIPHSVLLGTDSFWEGVDVPGKALEILLITKLPFDVPTEPVIQAKAELIKKQGGNPFMDYTIPEAVIKFRQGFGRLIRHRSDYGAVIILDNRVIKKLYGRIFLKSLPLEPRLFKNEEDLWENLLKWFH